MQTNSNLAAKYSEHCRSPWQHHICRWALQEHSIPTSAALLMLSMSIIFAIRKAIALAREYSKITKPQNQQHASTSFLRNTQCWCKHSTCLLQHIPAGLHIGNILTTKCLKSSPFLSTIQPALSISRSTSVFFITIYLPPPNTVRIYSSTIFLRVAMAVQRVAQYTTTHSKAQHTCGLDTQCHSRCSAYT